LVEAGLLTPSVVNGSHVQYEIIDAGREVAAGIRRPSKTPCRRRSMRVACARSLRRCGAVLSVIWKKPDCVRAPEADHGAASKPSNTRAYTRRGNSWSR
jgi:hypothetical protein